MSAIATEREGFISFRDYRVWYRLVGDLEKVPAHGFPILMLPGGSGISHKSLKQSIPGSEWVHFEESSHYAMLRKSIAT